MYYIFKNNNLVHIQKYFYSSIYISNCRFFNCMLKLIFIFSNHISLYACDKNEGPWILQLMHSQTTDLASFALLINLSTTDTDSSLRPKPTCCSTADLLVFWRSTDLSAHYSTQYPLQCLLTQMHPSALHFVYKLYTGSDSTSMSYKRNYSQKTQSLIVPQTLVPIQYPPFCCNKSSAICQTQRKIKRHS
jgi:hypothetical protein